jgi:hypothetical protein
MRRTRAYRLLGIVFAPWFLAVAAGVPGLHICSHAEHAAMHAGHGGGHDHSHVPTAQHRVSSVAPDSPSDSPHPHQDCTCLGCCCAASGAALPDVPTTVFVAEVRQEEPAIAEHDRGFAARVEHALPFATAPPLPLIVEA